MKDTRERERERENIKDAMQSYNVIMTIICSNYALKL